MASPRHVIKQLTFDLHCRDRAQAARLEHEIINLYHSRLEQLLDECFSGLAGREPEWRIDRLELDLGRIKPERLRAEVPLRVAEQLRKTMADGGLGGVETVSEPERQLALLRHFLETGRQPWWAAKTDRTAFERLVERLRIDAPDNLRELIADIVADEARTRRFCNQLSDSCLAGIAGLYLPGRDAGRLARQLTDIEALYAELDSMRAGRRGDDPRRAAGGSPGQGTEQPGQQDGSPGRAGAAVPGAGARGSGREPDPHPARRRNKLRGHYWTSVLHSIAGSPAGRSGTDRILPETLAALTAGDRDALRRLLAGLEQAARSLAAAQYRFDVPVRELIETLSAMAGPGPGATATAPAGRPVPGAGAFREGSPAPAEYEAGAGTDRPGPGPATATSLTGKVTPGAARKAPARPPELPAPAGDRMRDPFSDTDEAFIDNAGLAILWPYLPALVSNLGLADEGRFIGEDAAERTVLLLQHLVEPGADITEAALSLNKLLCGLELNRPVPVEFSPSEREESECEALLGAVRQHWAVLKNLSAERIRSDFLQRRGIIRPCADNWRLRVENQAQDILMQKIPWPTGVVKLPWMQFALLVHWD